MSSSSNSRPSSFHRCMAFPGTSNLGRQQRANRRAARSIFAKLLFTLAIAAQDAFPGNGGFLMLPGIEMLLSLFFFILNGFSRNEVGDGEDGNNCIFMGQKAHCLLLENSFLVWDCRLVDDGNVY
ncbi:hypothetical protein TNCV_664521 [Trichonephila clavipes]|nr:hypothetical protein TNCV_664521 [Trichonephila clavipes]